jgi:hypothetical protein
MHAAAAGLDRLCLDIDGKLARRDDGLRLPSGAARNGQNARDHIVCVEHPAISSSVI